MYRELAVIAYSVKDVPRAVAFYRDVIGLKPSEMFTDYWAEFAIGDRMTVPAPRPSFSMNERRETTGGIALPFCFDMGGAFPLRSCGSGTTTT